MKLSFSGVVNSDALPQLKSSPDKTSLRAPIMSMRQRVFYESSARFPKSSLNSMDGQLPGSLFQSWKLSRVGRTL